MQPITRRFVLSNPLVTSALTGVTHVDQLPALVSAAERGPLDPSILEHINAIHMRFPNPTP